MNTTITIVGICAGLYFAFVGAYLSVLMGRILRQNGRVLDRIDKTTGMLADKIDKTTEMLAEKIDKTTGMLADKIDKTMEKLDEGFKLIARLIVEENESTRREILEALKK